MKQAVDILKDLVAIPSVSSQSNRPVIDYAHRKLDAKAWKIRLHPYVDPAGVDKVNLVALTGREPAELALVCHTDTVPFASDWKEAVHPRVRDGKLYG